MNVLMISDEYPPSGGGAGVVAQQIVRDCKNLGVGIDLIAGSGDFDPSVDNYARNRNKKFLWIYDFKNNLNKLRIKNKKYENIILNDQTAIYLGGLFLSKNELQNTDIIIHGLYSRFIYDKDSFRKTILMFRKFFERSIVLCNRIICVSKSNSEEFLKYIPQDLRQLVAAKLEVHYVGIPIDDLSPQKCSMRLERRQGSFVLLSASRIEALKGYHLMLEMFCEAIMSGANLTWNIVGSGRYEPVLAAAVKDRGLDEHVFFLGRVERSQLFSLYQEADAFWLMSPAEAVPLVFLEAAYFGLPSLGPRTGGAVEAICEGGSGVVIDDLNGQGLLEGINKIKKNTHALNPNSFATQFDSKKFISTLLSPLF